jgi:uncharacterized protein YutE (UPF0331/DUF86 family)
VDFRSGSRRVGLVDPDRVRERLGRLEPLLALLDEVRASGEHAYFSALQAKLATQHRKAAGLRNLLVHGYAEVDDRKVWEALAGLDDLRDYAAAVNRAISS